MKNLLTDFILLAVSGAIVGAVSGPGARLKGGEGKWIQENAF